MSNDTCMPCEEKRTVAKELSDLSMVVDNIRVMANVLNDVVCGIVNPVEKDKPLPPTDLASYIGDTTSVAREISHKLENVIESLGFEPRS